MKKIFTSSVCALTVFLSMSVAKPVQQGDDPAKLKAVLTNFFNAIGTQDFDALKAATTTDFILYEDGRLWNMDSAFMNIKAHMPFTVKYTMANMKINVDSRSGDATYTNHGDFEYGSVKRSLDWIESATFRKIDGVWKINFLQATIRK